LDYHPLSGTTASTFTPLAEKELLGAFLTGIPSFIIIARAAGNWALENNRESYQIHYSEISDYHFKC
jgi:hypothetical protein